MANANHNKNYRKASVSVSLATNVIQKVEDFAAADQKSFSDAVDYLLHMGLTYLKLLSEQRALGSQETDGVEQSK